MKIKEIHTKSIIVKSKLPDADYVINPYIGCQHGCIYCYATFMKKFSGHQNDEWGTFVDIKKNAIDTIPVNKDFNGSTILIGSVTDPYQGVERRYKVTNKILNRLRSVNAKIEIITKSSLIQNDIKTLKALNNVKVGISISSTDINVSRRIEPFAPSPKSRLETLKRLKKEGIPNYLFISPIFPFITDFNRIIREMKPYADEILFENLNIRRSNKKNILSFIKEFFPEQIDFYLDLKNSSSYWEGVKKEIIDTCKIENVKYKIYFEHN